MSNFRQIASRLDEIEQLSALLRVQEAESDEERKKQHIMVERMSADLCAYEPKMAKFVRLAKETDPDKVVYAPAMVKKVLEAEKKFASLPAVVHEISVIVGKRYEHVLAKEMLIAKQLQQEDEERANERRIQEEAEKIRKNEEKVARELARQKQQQEAEEMKQREQEQARKDRLEFEALEQTRQERNARLQRAADSNISLEEALDILHTSCKAQPGGSSVFTKAVSVLCHILGTISANPDDHKLRRIRISNPQFQQDIARHTGGEECLVAIGYRQLYVEEVNLPGIWHWYLEEPKMENLDEWAMWFESLQNSKRNLEDRLHD